jgi:tetratricopeptide (TPR) repeat protein
VELVGGACAYRRLLARFQRLPRRSTHATRYLRLALTLPCLRSPCAAVCAPLRSAAPPPRRRAVAPAPRASAGPLLELAQGLEAPVQIAYLTALLALLAGGSYLVVRQVLVRRELEESAKALGERVRDGSASAEELFEMGCVMLRKKVYTQAVRQLEAALAAWDGEAEERAQVHNALGFALAAQDKTAPALEQYRAAVALQPGYVTAWNNMGDTLEKTKAYKEALDAYSEALSYAPDNAIARDRAAFLRTRIARTAL